TTAKPGGGPVTGAPSRRTTPAVGASSPAAQRNNVVLPHPDGPTTQTNSAGATANVRSAIASTRRPDASYTLRSAANSSIAASVVPAEDPCLDEPEPQRQHHSDQPEQQHAAPHLRDREAA